MTNFSDVELEYLVKNGSILAIQDGNHGEKHPKATDYVESGLPRCAHSFLHIKPGLMSWLSPLINSKIKLE